VPNNNLGGTTQRFLSAPKIVTAPFGKGGSWGLGIDVPLKVPNNNLGSTGLACLSTSVPRLYWKKPAVAGILIKNLPL
jgi:hypothetical protein